MSVEPDQFAHDVLVHGVARHDLFCYLVIAGTTEKQYALLLDDINSCCSECGSPCLSFMISELL